LILNHYKLSFKKLAPILSLPLSLSLILSLSLSLSLSKNHTHTHTRNHSLSNKHTQSLSPPLLLSLSLSNTTHKQAISLSLSLSRLFSVYGLVICEHIHTPTLSHLCTHSLSHITLAISLFHLPRLTVSNFHFEIGLVWTRSQRAKVLSQWFFLFPNHVKIESPEITNKVKLINVGWNVVSVDKNVTIVKLNVISADKTSKRSTKRHWRWKTDVSVEKTSSKATTLSSSFNNVVNKWR